MRRSICIHGHFYQPPRENPWTGEVEPQDSATPYHDWNARITAECYAPNASSRILDADGRIISIVNNYASISFDFGPALLRWLKEHEPGVYAAILSADKESAEQFLGHGAAIAQVYPHVIMPLANDRDRQTHVLWGIRDFVHRFGRRPEGMWLPETAVDTSTLEVLAGQGIVFTILSPEQASRVKKITERAWTDVRGGGVDCSRPYLCRLPSGASIVILLYEAGIAQEVAFSPLLENGERFASRMMRYFTRSSTHSGLLCIASDGETYGHHHRFGDMALAYALHLVRTGGLAEITLPGAFLEANPPQYEVEIREHSSWSCVHGIERWRSDCGCSTRGTIMKTCSAQAPGSFPVPGEGGGEGSGARTWRQDWRTPLRAAMDWLRDRLVPVYEDQAGVLFSDPWSARDDYIGVILDRSPETVEQYLSRHAIRPLSGDEKITALRLLEMQRHAMLMFTSCGWFFDDISGIEPVQVMRHACRAMQLAADIAGVEYEPGYISRLANARSNVPAYGNGATVYNTFVRPSVIDHHLVMFHSGVYSLVQGKPDTGPVHDYAIRYEAFSRYEAGRNRMVLGKAMLHSEITWEEHRFIFVVVQAAGCRITGGVREHTDDESFVHMQESMRSAFCAGDPDSLSHTINELFGTRSFTLTHLSRDGQRKVLYTLLGSGLDDMGSVLRQSMPEQDEVLERMRELQVPVPPAARGRVELLLNLELSEMLAAEKLDHRRLRQLVDALVAGRFSPDSAMLSVTAGASFTDLVRELRSSHCDILLLEGINDLFSILQPLSLEMDLRECQNDYFQIGNQAGREMREREKNGDKEAIRWVRQFSTLGEYLGVKMP